MSRDKISPSVAEAIGWISRETQTKLIRTIENGWRRTVRQVVAFDDEEKRKALSKSQATIGSARASNT